MAFAVFTEGVGGTPPANMGWCMGFAGPQATVKVAGVCLKHLSSLKNRKKKSKKLLGSLRRRSSSLNIPPS